MGWRGGIVFKSGLSGLSRPSSLVSTRPGPIHLPRDHRDQQIDRGGEPQRLTRPEDLEQEERREQAAGDGAERVDRVERRQVLPPRVAWRG